MKHLLTLITTLLTFSINAQVGYQVSLLDSKTGEPRANENVNVTIRITDSNGTTICEEQNPVISDAFGVLSMTVGNENTFSNVDWRNTPLKISATIDGITIGSCDILTVPVAEYAKRTGVLTPKILAGLSYTDSDDSTTTTITFSEKGTATEVYTCTTEDGTYTKTTKFTYDIQGNTIYLYYDEYKTAIIFRYNAKTGRLYES